MVGKQATQEVLSRRVLMGNAGVGNVGTTA